MDVYAKLSALATLALTIGAILVTFWSPDSFRWRLVVVFLFVVVGILGVALQEEHDKRERQQAAASQAELLNWQRGDPDHPPRVWYIRHANPNGALDIEFLMMNDSEFPAYDINVRIWDNDNFKGDIKTQEEVFRRSIAIKAVPSLTPHTVQTIAEITVPSGATGAKTFGAQYMTRTGGFMQEIKAQKVEGVWYFATSVRRLTTASEVVFEQVEDGFPRNAKGGIDWD